MSWILELNSYVNDFVWGLPMLVLLIGTGFYLAVRTRFAIYRNFGLIVKETAGNVFGGKAEEEGGITPFQAMSTAMAASVGTGNIAGVALAISVGGPGAIFWMWIAAILGMTTKFSEVTLSVATRQRNDSGELVGGPMYYIKNGLGSKWLSRAFALFAVFAPLGVGSMVQANSISEVLQASFNVPTWLTGVVLVILAALVILGGISRISSFAEKIVPLMAAAYVLGGVVILVINSDQIPQAFQMIFTQAFTGTAAVGGFAGATIATALRQGVSRGVFTNEAGLGSGPIAHAAAETDHPVRQGLWGAFEVFLDTIVICTLTALVIITSGVWQNSSVEGAAMTRAAFESGFTGGGYIVTIGLLLFAFTTIIGWSYYGEKAFGFLAGTSKFAIVYRVVYIGFLYVGSVGGLAVIWGIADTLNGLMAIPNLIGLFGLSGMIVRLTKDFFQEPELKRPEGIDWLSFRNSAPDTTQKNQK